MKVEAEAVIPSISREVFERNAVQGNFTTIAPVSGSQAGENQLTLTMPLHGIDSSTPTGNPSAHPESLILSALLGGSSSANYLAGKINQSGSDADTISADSGGAFEAGAGLIVGTTAAKHEMGFIENASNQESLELRTPLSDATIETDNSTAYGTVNSFLTTGDTSAFSILVRSLDNDSQVLCSSCVPVSCSITMDAKGMPMFEATFWVNAVSQGGENSSLDEYSYTYPVMSPMTGNNSARLCFGTASATDWDCSGFSVSIEQEIIPQLGHGADTGVRGVTVTNRTVTCEFSGLAGSVNPWDTAGNLSTIYDLNNTTDGSAAVQLTHGSVPGQCFGIHLPRPVLTSPPTLSDAAGLWNLAYTASPGNYSGDTPSASAESSANRPFVVAFG